MKRYHAVFSHNGSGGYCEFSASDDAAAIAQAHDMARNYGEIRYLAEVTRGVVETRREVSTGGGA